MYEPATDLAGEVCFAPNFWQTKARINYLIEEYLSCKRLCDKPNGMASLRLEDLPQQFKNPQPRQWSKINWQEIHPQQVIGLELDIFLSIIKGALDTEAPIREYTQTSRKYLEPIHLCMAKFVGAIVGEDEEIVKLGLWEKEERQHTPALSKIYYLLSKEIVIPQLRKVKQHQARSNAYRDLYRHGLHRVATEYGAVCLYLWLMSHTTDTLQQALRELLEDKINHLTKFWGIGMWLYPDGAEQLIKCLLNEIHTMLPVSYESKRRSSIKSTFECMMSILEWQSWSILSQSELIYTFIWILRRMWYWSSQLTLEYLYSCCASPSFFGNNSGSDLSKITVF